tara:strand:- start:10637 stop:11614 length:978 start_codon:yes stop_codon:yes gene_type:complete
MVLPNLSFFPGANARNGYALAPISADVRTELNRKKDDSCPLALKFAAAAFVLVFVGLVVGAIVWVNMTSDTAVSAHGAVGIASISNADFRRDGYAIAKGVFSHGHVDELRRRVLELAPTEGSKFHPWFVPSFFDPGMTIPAFQNRSQFAFMRNITNHTRLHDALRMVFGNHSYMYTGHNDIGIDRVVGWHKDRLNDDYRKYEKHDLWGDGEHMIVKAAIYLQDHAQDEDAMLFVPGSHLSRDDPALESSHDGVVRMHPQKGDVLIFEQRSTHRGRQWSPSDVMHTRPPRILISLGYGLVNEMTREFAAGTEARQRDQCGAKCDLT